MNKPIRQIRIEGNIAYVPLTQGYTAVIDAADAPVLCGYNWRALVRNTTVYAWRFDKSGPKHFAVLMHRVIMCAPAGADVDHADCDGLNNRRANLRIATRAQNRQNSRVRRDSASGIKGVWWHRQKKKWQAQIGSSGGLKRHLGYHDTKEDAHAAYCKASAELHGEFGRAV